MANAIRIISLYEAMKLTQSEFRDGVFYERDIEFRELVAFSVDLLKKTSRYCKARDISLFCGAYLSEAFREVVAHLQRLDNLVNVDASKVFGKDDVLRYRSTLEDRLSTLLYRLTDEIKSAKRETAARKKKDAEAAEELEQLIPGLHVLKDSGIKLDDLKHEYW